jgi:hypothetical protein
MDSNPSIVQPVPSHYTDCAIQTPMDFIHRYKILLYKVGIVRSRTQTMELNILTRYGKETWQFLNQYGFPAGLFARPCKISCSFI